MCSKLIFKYSNLFLKQQSSIAWMESTQGRPSSPHPSLAVIRSSSILLSPLVGTNLFRSHGRIDCWKWNCRVDFFNVSDFSNLI